MKKLWLCALTLSFLSLGACEGTHLFSDKDKPPLKGERLSILDLQNSLNPDPALQSAPLSLPPPETNKTYAQRGGSAVHISAHLELSASLQKVWEQKIGKRGLPSAPLIAPPVVAQGMVYTLNNQGVVTAFAVSDGKEKWRQSTVPQGEDADSAGALGGGLALGDNKIYVVNGYKQLSALDAGGGAVLWSRPLLTPARTAPTLAEGRLYIITLDNRLSVFEARDGTPVWEYQGTPQETTLLGSAAPAVSATLAVLPLSSGELIGLRPENGQVVWEENLSALRQANALGQITDIRALPVIDEDRVFAGSYSGRFMVLDAISGRRLWQHETGLAETPFLAGNTLFAITTDQHLVAFSKDSGAVRWRIQLPRYEGDDKEDFVVWSGPILAGGRLLLVSSIGQILEVKPDDGKEIKSWSVRGNVGVAVPPVVAEKTLFLITDQGRLVAYR